LSPAPTRRKRKRKGPSIFEAFLAEIEVLAQEGYGIFGIARHYKSETWAVVAKKERPDLPGYCDPEDTIQSRRADSIEAALEQFVRERREAREEGEE